MNGPKLRLKLYAAAGRKVLDDEVDYAGVFSPEQAAKVFEAVLAFSKKVGTDYLALEKEVLRAPG